MIVQNGRSIDIPTDQMRIVGYDAERRENVMAKMQRRVYPGEEVVLPQSEALRLQKLGFLVPPDEYTPPPTPAEDGIQRIGPRPREA